MAAVLQRSVTSFRRQGSSGLVWDERFFSGEVNLIVEKPYEEEDKYAKQTGLRQSLGDGPVRTMRCPTRVCPRTPPPPRVVAEPPTPLSPKISGRGCGFWGIFSRPVAKNSTTNRATRSSNKLKS